MNLNENQDTPSLPARRKMKKRTMSRGKINTSINTSVHERNLVWDMKRKMKIAQLKESLVDREIEECTFKPSRASASY